MYIYIDINIDIDIICIYTYRSSFVKFTDYIFIFNIVELEVDT